MGYVSVLLVILMGLLPGTAGAAAKTYTNSIGMEFVLIPAGSFIMGAPFSIGTWSNEYPQHKVKISKPFYLGKYEVTQAQWMQIDGFNPSDFKGDDRPVDMVSWNEAQEFILKLNAKEGGKLYRLPTEAEWEYAARAGTSTQYYWGDDENMADQYAWSKANSDKQSHPVGQKLPNPWGLYDMLGNLAEFCQDWYDGRYYDISPPKDPSGPTYGEKRIERGGSWLDGTDVLVRITSRTTVNPVLHDYKVGFRLVRMIP